MIFTCSMSDWFHKDADPWRDEAWAIIKATPHHTYQILTKRPGRMARHLPADWGDGYPNVWLGVSVESQKQTFRIRQLRDVPARVRFVSAEPLLGPLDLSHGGLVGIHWLIVGGESGPDGVRREMDLQWPLDLQFDCRDAGTAFFFKQRSGRTSELTDGVPADLLVREYPEER
jgi:protein gp37